MAQEAKSAARGNCANCNLVRAGGIDDNDSADEAAPNRSDGAAAAAADEVALAEWSSAKSSRRAPPPTRPNIAKSGTSERFIDERRKAGELCSDCCRNSNSNSNSWTKSSKSNNEHDNNKDNERKADCSKANSSNSNSNNSAEDDAKNETGFEPLVGLTWPARITMILVGASLFFALFFALEFLIARMAALCSVGHATRIPSAAAAADEPKPMAAHLSAASALSASATSHLSRGDNGHGDGFADWQCNIERKRRDGGGNGPKSKLGFDFATVFESESDFGSIAPENRLGRLLSAHHLAMPFDPNVWHFSDANEFVDEWLSGSLDICLEELRSILREINQSLLVGSSSSSSLLLSQPNNLSAAEEATSGRSPMMNANGATTLKVMRLLDSFGRPEAGSLEGQPFWLGSYTQCSKLDSTRYCIGKFVFKEWLKRAEQADASIKIGLCLPKRCDSSALFKAKAAADETFNQQQQQQQAANNISSLTFERKMNEMNSMVKQLALLNFSPKFYYPNELALADVYCLPLEERRGLSMAAKVLIAFLSLWLVLLAWFAWLRKWRRRRRRRWMRQTLSSSLASSGSGARRRRRCLGARICSKLRQVSLGIGLSDEFVETLALDSNVERFFELADFRPTSEKQQQVAQPSFVDLNTLAGVKHLGCIGIIAAHVLLTNLSLGTAYLHTIETIGPDLRTMLLLSLNNIVDTFFVISGLLIAYLTFKRMTPPSKLNSCQQPKTNETSGWTCMAGAFARAILNRYLRTAPLYLCVYAFVKLIGARLGDGPLWDYATNENSLRGACRRESWLWPIGFASDFKPLAQHCIPAAWSVAVDMQFFLVMPFLVALLRQARPKVAYTFIGLLIVCSSARTINDYQSLLDYVSAKHFGKLRLHVFTVLIRHVAHAYSQPQNRFSPILIGLLGGHLLHRYECRCERLQLDRRRKKHSSSEVAEVEALLDESSLNSKQTNSSSNNNNSSPERPQQRQQQAAGSLRAWPSWLMSAPLGLALVVALNVLFAMAPMLVQLRERLQATDSICGNSSQVQLHSTSESAVFFNSAATKVAGNYAPTSDGQEAATTSENNCLVEQLLGQQKNGSPVERGWPLNGRADATRNDSFIVRDEQWNAHFDGQRRGSYLQANGVVAAAAENNEDFDFQLALVGFVLIKPLWSLCNCVIFLRLTTDLSRKTLLGRILSMQFWRLLSKLNYALLLVHFEVIAFEQMSRLSLAPITWIELLCKFSYAYLCSLTIALLLYVLFEQPMRRLTTHLLERKPIFWTM